MRYQIFFVGLIFIIFISYQSEANNKCFTAKTCLHNAKEICGEDHNQGTRRFFDTCDMKEYNCLQGTSYVKVPFGHCRNLPPIEEKSTEKILQKNEEMPNDEQDAEKSLQIDAENSKQEQDAENSLEIHEENSRQEHDEEKTTEKYEDNSKQEKEAEESLQIHEANSKQEQDAEKSLKIREENSNQEQDTEKSLHIQEESSKQEQDAEPAIGEAQDAAKLKAEDVTRKDIDPGKAAVLSEYWCWRAKYCHAEGGLVCGRDRRLNLRRKFNTACDLYKHNCNYQHVLSLFNMEISALTNHPSFDDSPVVRERFAQFNCFKLKTCTPGGDKVCGFDDTQIFLAEFEDLCTLYKKNCEKRGMFRPIEASICEGQKKYLSQPRDTMV